MKAVAYLILRLLISSISSMLRLQYQPGGNRRTLSHRPVDMRVSTIFVKISQLINVDLIATFVSLDVLSPTQQYHKLIADNTLRGDNHQTRIIHKLQHLHDQLKTYNPPLIPDPSLQNSIVRPPLPFSFPSSRLTPSNPPRYPASFPARTPPTQQTSPAGSTFTAT